MAQTQREKDEKKFQELKSLVNEQDGRLHDIQTSAFQLANYYFVFQGVILAAISNTSHLTCSDRWFLFTLSLLAAILNLSALFNMGNKYITTMMAYEINWCHCNRLSKILEDHETQRSPTARDQENGNQARLEDHETQSSPIARDQENGNQAQNQPTSDQYKMNKRYMYLVFCILLFLGFAGVTLSGCWRILCEHNDCRHHHHNENCVKVCHGVNKCMKICYDN